jgi:predicted N-acyltransferase
MADPDPEVIARLHPGFADIGANEWDSLSHGGDPFVTHAFLSLLERSGSIGGNSGWTPLPVTVEAGEALLGAAPAFLKTHSQGEYVFDHGWAEAWERAGGAYYPKLQVAVPFTPVPGRRLLGGQPQALLAALEMITRQNELSSAHNSFCTSEEAQLCEQAGWLVRHGLQYHWFNRGYGGFDDFLATLSSRKRKQLRKERAAAVDGLEIVALRGSEIGAADWEAMWRFYQHTGARKWGRPYLTRAFFDQVGEAMGDACLLFLAKRDGVRVAGALNLVGRDTLYGRYWGASEEIPFLHFELSYYRAMEWAIDHGLAVVQAGAQGKHKLARGYEPVTTYSAHFLPDPGFRRAVAEFLRAEREAIGQERAWAAEALPYRSDASS